MEKESFFTRYKKALKEVYLGKLEKGGSKTKTKVYEDTVLVKFPLYCCECKKEIIIDVIQLKMVLSK